VTASYPSYLEAVLSICNPWTRHTIEARNPHNVVDNAPLRINQGFDQKQQPGKQRVNGKNHIKTQLLASKLNSSKQAINYVNSLKLRNIIFHRLFDSVELCQIYSFVLFSIICSPFVLEAAWG
jgi:hypothetical protein